MLSIKVNLCGDVGCGLGWEVGWGGVRQEGRRGGVRQEGRRGGVRQEGRWNGGRKEGGEE